MESQAKGRYSNELNNIDTNRLVLYRGLAQVGR